jgi:hypothetical protein
MSALYVLYFVLPFPVLVFLHEVERLIACLALGRECVLGFGTELFGFRCGSMRPVRVREAGLWVIAIKNVLLTCAVLCFVICRGEYSDVVWSVAVMVCGWCMLAMLVRALVDRGYSVGMLTALLSLPYLYLVISDMLQRFPAGKAVACVAASVLLAGADGWLSLRLAARAGK